MRKTITIKTEKQFIDITKIVQDTVKESNIKEGLVHVFAKHTTCGIKIMEDEILSFSDIISFLDSVAPLDGKYRHNLIAIRDVPPDERINGCSHVRMLFFPSSETIPVSNGRLMLGKWQRIFLVEMDWDMPFRDRTIIVTVIPVGDKSSNGVMKI